MNELQFKGKYIIQQKDKTIQQKNSLTFYGALQLARLLKKDIYCSKNNKGSFGNTKIYDGEYKKISIKDGSFISFPQYNIDGSQNKIQLQGNNITTNYAFDDVYSTFVMIKAGDNNSTQYSFDLNLKRAINLGKIGIVAKVLGDDVTEESNYAYDVRSLQQWAIMMKPQGKNIVFKEGSEYSKYDGKYLKVYNSLYSKINNKSYYICKKEKEDGDSVFYCFCYYSSKNAWAIFEISLQTNAEAIYNVEDYLNHEIERIINNDDEILPVFLFSNETKDGEQPLQLDLQSTKDYSFNKIDKQTTGVISSSVRIEKQIDLWVRPIYKMHNYMGNFTTNMQNVSTENFRYMQLIADNNSNIKMYNQASGKASKKIQYSNINNVNDLLLAYNSYSFQGFDDFCQLYNYTSQKCEVCGGTGISKNADDASLCTECQGRGYFVIINNEGFFSPKYSRQNYMGFIPYVKTIKFIRLTDSTEIGTNSSGMEKKPTIFYGIDLYEKCSTPYNPIKIALSSSKTFNEANSWFVDNISVVQNKIVFTKQLSYTQGNSESQYKYIALFGNFNGHLNGTLSTDIVLTEENCYSMAEFAIPWKKQSDEAVVLTYQLSLDNKQENQLNGVQL